MTPALDDRSSGFSREEIISLLGAVAVFSGLEQQALEELASETESVHVHSGTSVVEEGEPGDALYVIASGRLRVFVADEGGDRPVRELSRGDIFGEISLVTGTPRRASVRTIRDSELLRLPAAAFHRLVERRPDLLRQASAVLVEQLAGNPHGNDRAGTVKTIAIVPAGAPMDLSEPARELTAALGRHGRATCVDSGAVEEAVGRGASTHPHSSGRGAVARYLHNVESAHEYVVYQADSSPSQWLHWCLRQADVVLLIADANATARAGDVDEILLHDVSDETAPRRELVLLHPGTTRAPAGTARWLAIHDVVAHHHVRRGRVADWQRVARFLTGRACGLVLSGGGARGFAHLGVMQALEEAGVPIDFIGATSIGAVMGGLYAIGVDHDARVRMAGEAFTASGPLVGFTLPLVSLSSGRTITRLLRDERGLGSRDIADLWTRFFCVSADLISAELVVHERGELWRAVRASLSLPGILPPVAFDGMLLVDGGVMNNLPIDVMAARLGGGPVVASDVGGGPEVPSAGSFEPVLSGWRLLLRRVNPLTPAPPVPSIFDILYRLTELTSQRSKRAILEGQRVDLLVCPPVQWCGRLDFRAGRSLVAVGHSAAARLLETSPLRDRTW